MAPGAVMNWNMESVLGEFRTRCFSFMQIIERTLGFFEEKEAEESNN